MPTEEAQNPSQSTSEEDDFSKEIEIAEDIKKQALDHYKRESIDTWNIQHSIIRNYLWLSLTFIAGYCTAFNKAFDLGSLTDYCPLVALSIAFICALATLVIGIVTMTGTSTAEPDDNYVEMCKYLTSTGYHQGNHYALLLKEIKAIKQAIEEAQDKSHARGLTMRRMNLLLKSSIGFASLSVVLYLSTTLFQ